MAEEKALAFDTGIDKSGLEKGLAEIEEAIASTASNSEKDAEKAFDSMKSQVAKLANSYKEAGMTASDAMKKAWEEVRDGSSSFQTAERNVSGFAEKAESELQNVGEIASRAFDEVPQSTEKSLETAMTRCRRSGIRCERDYRCRHGLYPGDGKDCSCCRSNCRRNGCHE